LNFGESLKKWDKVMYSKPRCKIVNNGYISESFKLSRGVKQGCPLSAYLFIMVIEMLAIKVRSNNNIKGLEIRGLQTKVSLYADDSCFLLIPQLESLHSLIEDLDTFANLSGLKPNYGKCTILCIGSLKLLHYHVVD
jgi:hypothetical protein